MSAAADSPAELAPLPWQDTAWQRITAIRAQDRLAHALLISGPRGCGKQQFARALAAALLCRAGGADGQACGRCADCRRLAGGAHPGFIAARPEPGKRDIAVEAVRTLCERLSMTSHDGGLKVALIDPADALNLNGVNALLKTIEEPPGRSHLLLISERPLALRATLRSRCQQLRLPLPERAAARAWLAQRADSAAGADLDAALDGANGAPLLALELLGEGVELQRGWRKLLAEFGAGRGDPLAAAAAVGEERAGDFLRWLFGFVLARLRADAAGTAAPAAVRELGGLVDELLEQLRRLDNNAKPQLVLEALLIRWRGALAQPGES